MILPEDVAERPAEGEPLPVNVPRDPSPSVDQVTGRPTSSRTRSTRSCSRARGWRATRPLASLLRFSERLQVPVATTFLGKGVFPDDHPNALGTIGFMVKDYANFGFDLADVVVAVGYDLVEYAPSRGTRPATSRSCTCTGRWPRWTRTTPSPSGSRVRSARPSMRSPRSATCTRIGGGVPPVKKLVREELDRGAADDAFPLSPARIVADIREAMGRQDIVLCDTGAAKMWMARLYPTYAPNTCLISNGLATMAFALPGAFAAKLAFPDRKVLAAVGDGAFLMSAAEIETAVREHVPIVILVWVDGGYGLIGWKQDIHFGRRAAVSFDNPDFVRYAESFGARGYAIRAAGSSCRRSGRRWMTMRSP